MWEDERGLDGTLTPVLTIFLTGAECPFTCVFCDLWRHTLDGPTPPGAIPAQVERALWDAGALPKGAAVKLYNASNFFDPRAVPPEDDQAIAALLHPFTRVTVECHPRLVQRRCLDFAGRIRGTLEVAMGLETAHSDVLAQLNKGMTLEDFASAAAVLKGAGVSLRVFILVPPPQLTATEAIEWVVRSVQYAVEQGAAHIALIPTRGGNGALEDLHTRGAFTPATLDLIEEVLDRCRGTADAVVTVDLWDIDRVATCRLCGPTRIARLRTINRTGRYEARVLCPTCMSLS